MKAEQPTVRAILEVASGNKDGLSTRPLTCLPGAAAVLRAKHKVTKSSLGVTPCPRTCRLAAEGNRDLTKIAKEVIQQIDSSLSSQIKTRQELLPTTPNRASPAQTQQETRHRRMRTKQPHSRTPNRLLKGSRRSCNGGKIQQILLHNHRSQSKPRNKIRSRRHRRKELLDLAHRRRSLWSLVQTRSDRGSWRVEVEHLQHANETPKRHLRSLRYDLDSIFLTLSSCSPPGSQYSLVCFPSVVTFHSSTSTPCSCF